MASGSAKTIPSLVPFCPRGTVTEVYNYSNMTSYVEKTIANDGLYIIKGQKNQSDSGWMVYVKNGSNWFNIGSGFTGNDANFIIPLKAGTQIKFGGWYVRIIVYRL